MTAPVDLPPLVAGLAASLLPLEGPGPPSRIPPRVRRAAVLVLLFPRGDGISFLLTQRPHTLRRHPGQISLPGGGWEPEDRDLWDTARREAHEELGLSVDALIPLGRLEEVLVSVSNYVITPFVAWLPHAPVLEVDEREVAHVIEVPLEALLDPGAMGEEIWERRGMPWRVSFYRFEDRQVWGATARILSGLAGRLRPAATPAAFPPGSVRPAWRAR